MTLAPVIVGLIATAAGHAPASLPAEAAPPDYTVVSGDTVSGIAQRFGLHTADVLALNGLDRSSLIFPGQVLVLGGPIPLVETAVVAPAPPPAPAPSVHVVAGGETVSGIAAAAGVGVQAMLDANGLTWSSIIYPGQSLVVPLPPAPAAAPAPAPVPATPEPLTAAELAAAGQIVPMSDEMRANATVIVSVGRAIGVSDQALVVALAAAAQESGVRNLDHGDLDSLGVFQQRPSTGWGTPDEVRDTTRSAYAFFGGATNPNAGRTRGLLDIPGWESMSVTAAAQAVQISAFPDAYAKWEISARAWLAQLG